MVIYEHQIEEPKKITILLMGRFLECFLRSMRFILNWGDKLARRKEAIQGYLFETLIKELVKKAGFSIIIDSKQVTPSFRFKGRGATHQIDVHGEFKFSIPFIYPINILGETKGYYNPKRTVSLAVARNFCGVIKDIQEWYHIDLTKAGERRFEKVGEKRFTHCGVIFSLTGFGKSAIEYCWAHGIYTISYENNPLIRDTISLSRKLSNEVLVTKLPGSIRRAFKNKSFEEVSKTLNPEAKRQNFDKTMEQIKNETSSMFSYFGMLNGRFVCNILSRLELKNIEGEKLIIKFEEGVFKLTDLKNTMEGYFSISKQFLKFYFKKKNNIKNIFGYIDIFFIQERTLEVKKYFFDESSIEELIVKLPKYIELKPVSNVNREPRSV
jgi:hypothetical protein